MRPFLCFVLVLQIYALASSSAAWAQGPSCVEPIRVPIPVEESFVLITKQTLAGFVGVKPEGFALEGVEKPHHGDLEWDASGIRYTPQDEFWSLRSDSFTYRFSRPSTSGLSLGTKKIQTGMIQLVAQLSATASMFDNFEVSLEHCGWTVANPEGQLSLMERPVGSGRHWLNVSEGAPQPARLSLVPSHPVPNHPGGEHLTWPPECSSNPTHGTTDDCFTMNFAGPPNPDFQGELTLFRAHLVGPHGEVTPPLEIRLQRHGQSPAQVYATDGNGCATASSPVGSHNTTLQLDLWRDHDHDHGGVVGGGGAGLMLRLDDRVVGVARCLSPLIDDLVETELGLVEVATTDAPQLMIDNFAIGDRDPEWTLPPVGWRIAPFECGHLDDWTAIGGWAPTLSRAAALTGVAGLEVDLGAIAESSSDEGFLHDDAPNALTTFNLRFRIDPHTTSLLTPHTLVLASASDHEVPHGSGHLGLELSTSGSGVRLRARQVDDTGTPYSTLWADLGFPGLAHVVELQWRAASGPGTDDGFVRLWIDGTQVGEVLGLDNDTRRVRSFQLGAREVPTSALGILYLDDVETWN